MADAGGTVVTHNVDGMVHLHHGTHIHEPSKDRLLFITLVAVMAVMSVAISVWKSRHPRSFSIATLVALWLFPAVFAAATYAFRFVLIWIVYSGMMAWMLRSANKKPMAASTPRAVYTFFRRAYDATSACVVFSYTFFAAIFLAPGLSPLVPVWLFDVIFMFMTNGLYFAVLTRDVAEVAAERINMALGYYKKDDDDNASDVPENVCALCGNELQRGRELSVEEGMGADAADIDPATGQLLRSRLAALTDLGDAGATALKWHASSGGTNEKLITLPCQHSFHEFCIRGWTIVGKKHQCPCCTERVDLRSIAGGSVWGRTSVLWTQILDAVRYLVVWFPLIAAVIQLVSFELGIGRPMSPAEQAQHMHAFNISAAVDGHAH